MSARYPREHLLSDLPDHGHRQNPLHETLQSWSACAANSRCILAHIVMLLENCRTTSISETSLDYIASPAQVCCTDRQDLTESRQPLQISPMLCNSVATLLYCSHYSLIEGAWWSSFKTTWI